MNSSSMEKQEFLDLVQPHLGVLQAKAYYWTCSPAAADRLLDAFLELMAGRLNELRVSANTRLLLVRELFLQAQQAVGTLDTALAPAADAPRSGTPRPLNLAEQHEDLPHRATPPAEGRGNGLLQGQARTPPKSPLPPVRAVSGHF